MRQILVFVTCEICHARFGYDDSASGSDAENLDSIMRIIELFAEQPGWHAFRNTHQCRECTLRKTHPDEFI